MAIIPRRLRHERRGFRARMSSGWYAVDSETSTPLGGPFRNKSTARAECNRLQEIKAMGGKDVINEQSTDEHAQTEAERGTDAKDDAGNASGDQEGESSGDDE